MGLTPTLIAWYFVITWDNICREPSEPVLNLAKGWGLVLGKTSDDSNFEWRLQIDHIMMKKKWSPLSCPINNIQREKHKVKENSHLLLKLNMMCILFNTCSYIQAQWMINHLKSFRPMSTN